MAWDGLDRQDKVGVWMLFVCLAIIGLSLWGIMSRDAPVVKEEAWNFQFVSGTEYTPGQDGQLAVIVTNSSGWPITSEFTCSYTILYPNKTTFLSGVMAANTSIGTQYVGFVVPDVEGVYEYASSCFFDAPDVVILFGDYELKGDRNMTAAKSFHVSRGAQVELRAVITQ